MKRAHGFTLIELLVVISVMGCVGTILVGAVAHVRAEERLSAACADDLTGLRRAARLLREDLSEVEHPTDLAWRLDRGILERQGVAVARNVSLFEVIWEEDLLTAQLALGKRSDSPHRRDVAVDVCVARRPR